MIFGELQVDFAVVYNKLCNLGAKFDSNAYLSRIPVSFDASLQNFLEVWGHTRLLLMMLRQVVDVCPAASLAAPEVGM
eukprot:297393-Pelagomonas_calceolata.AAC.1